MNGLDVRGRAMLRRLTSGHGRKDCITKNKSCVSKWEAEGEGMGKKERNGGERGYSTDDGAFCWARSNDDV